MRRFGSFPCGTFVCPSEANCTLVPPRSSAFGGHRARFVGNKARCGKLPEPFEKVFLSSEKHRGEGFTLLEVLITFVITFLMVGIIYGSYQGVFGTMKGSRELLSDYRTASLLLRRLDEEIGSAFVASDLPFQGKKRELNFFTTKNFGRSDLTKINYFLRQNEEEELFLLRRESIPLSETIGRAFSLAPISAISFQYFDGEEWSFSWDSETKLPHSVAILLSLEEELQFSALIPVESS